MSLSSSELFLHLYSNAYLNFIVVFAGFLSHLKNHIYLRKSWLLIFSEPSASMMNLEITFLHSKFNFPTYSVTQVGWHKVLLT